MDKAKVNTVNGFWERVERIGGGEDREARDRGERGEMLMREAMRDMND